MAQEIELKLALDERDQRNFLRHPLLKQATGRQGFRLVNLYYDTPGLELRTRGIGLRLRAQGKLWLQTVKCAGQDMGGLSARPEWEAPYVGHFDFSTVDHPEVREWLERPKLKTRIAPVFETNFQRITWRFEPAPGTRIALMLDRGWIAAGGRRQAISEVEIELIEGKESYLLEMALALAERIPLVPDPLSKAERGYRLFRQIAPQAVKATPIPFAADAHPVAAFRQIGLACLDHLQRNHAGAMAHDDPEYIHQMRVATRRLRAALRLFGPLLPDGFADPLLPPLRDLMQVLGRARDLDVLLTEIAEPVLQALPDEPRLAALVGIITERGFDVRQHALRLLHSPAYGRGILQILGTLYGLKVGSGETATAHLRVIDFAENRLRRLRKKVLVLAAKARIDDPPSLHALRIGIKRLRYALEFFAPLASPKAMRRMLTQLVSLQDSLGQINDLANAGELLMSCADDDPRLREAVTLIGGWHGPRHQALLSAVPAGLKHLGNLRLPKFAA
jgi:inorganic triphosphatase YgiF